MLTPEYEVLVLYNFIRSLNIEFELNWILFINL